MMKSILVTLFSALLLTGCYQKINPSLVDTYTVEELCLGANATAVNGDTPLIELVRRKILTESDVALIKKKTIRAGMPECGLLAMLGLPKPPSYCGTINTSGGVYGSRKQYVYRPCGDYGKTIYVYVESGKVTSWQNW